MGGQQKGWNRGIPNSVSLFEGGDTCFLGIRNIVLCNGSMKLGQSMVTSTMPCFQYQKDCEEECPEKQSHGQLLIFGRHSVIFLMALLHGGRKKVKG